MLQVGRIAWMTACCIACTAQQQPCSIKHCTDAALCAAAPGPAGWSLHVSRLDSEYAWLPWPKPGMACRLCAAPQGLCEPAAAAGQAPGAAVDQQQHGRSASSSRQRSSEVIGGGGGGSREGNSAHSGSTSHRQSYDGCCLLLESPVGQSGQLCSYGDLVYRVQVGGWATAHASWHECKQAACCCPACLPLQRA
jgi:hypothetical protein